tara:strand:- start:5056 stop:5376 length:321 start_codon:yes stop_codon:yes gene_type:complete
MANHAEITTKEAWLFSDFGAEYAAKVFPAEMIEALPRYVRGDKAGKIKNHLIEWDKVERGGWITGGQGVETRVGKVIRARLIKRDWGQPSQVVAEFAKLDGKWTQV